MTLERDLSKLGLKENVIKVYLAIIKLGEPTVGDIQKETNLHKQLIYNAATELNNDNLINIFEVRGRKRFSAPNPAALEEKAEHLLQKAHQIVPRLLEISNQKSSIDDIRIYRGNKGVQHYYLSTIYSQPDNCEVNILGMNSKRYFEIFNQEEFAFKSFEASRITKKVKLNLLLFGDQKLELELNKNRQFVEIRIFEELIQTPNDIMIWHDRVGMLFYSLEPYVLDLSGTDTVAGFRAYFNAFWNKAIKIA